MLRYMVETVLDGRTKRFYVDTHDAALQLLFSFDKAFAGTPHSARIEAVYDHKLVGTSAR